MLKIDEFENRAPIGTIKKYEVVDDEKWEIRYNYGESDRFEMSVFYRSGDDVFVSFIDYWDHSGFSSEMLTYPKESEYVDDCWSRFVKFANPYRLSKSSTIQSQLEVISRTWGDYRVLVVQNIGQKLKSGVGYGFSNVELGIVDVDGKVYDHDEDFLGLKELAGTENMTLKQILSITNDSPNMFEALSIPSKSEKFKKILKQQDFEIVNIIRIG